MPLPHGLQLPRDLERQPTMSTVWELRPKSQIELAHVLEKEFWVHMLQSRPINPGDRVLVRAEDFSYCAELMFIEVDERRLWAKTRVLHLHWGDVGGKHVQSVVAAVAVEASTASDDWLIEYAGPHHRWRIRNPITDVVAEKGFQSRPDAEEALNVMRLEAAA